jgi:hypothetical protein
VHRILSLMALVAFLLEEMLHQKMRKAGTLPSAPTDAEVLKHPFDLFDLLRLLELLFLALLLSTPAGNPSTGHGQMCFVLLGLQVSRLFGRRILSRWSVLGVLQAIEVVFLITIFLMPADLSNISINPVSPWAVIALGGGISYGIFIAVSTAFSISYGIKFYSMESSFSYETFPPLASSESWALRFSVYSLFAGTAAFAGLLLLPELFLFSIFFGLTLVLQFTGVAVGRKTSYRGHHPLSHVLWGISFLILYILIISGISTTGTSL